MSLTTGDIPFPINVHFTDPIPSTTIIIGFAGKDVSLSRAPGWEPESWGYHGDDGNLFAAQSTGKPYGPTFGQGDTVGCLVNFRTATASFTKNGQDLGEVPLYSCPRRPGRRKFLRCGGFGR